MKRITFLFYAVVAYCLFSCSRGKPQKLEDSLPAILSEKDKEDVVLNDEGIKKDLIFYNNPYALDSSYKVQIIMNPYDKSQHGNELYLYDGKYRESMKIFFPDKEAFEEFSLLIKVYSPIDDENTYLIGDKSSYFKYSESINQIVVCFFTDDTSPSKSSIFLR